MDSVLLMLCNLAALAGTITTLVAVACRIYTIVAHTLMSSRVDALPTTTHLHMLAYGWDPF